MTDLDETRYEERYNALAPPPTCAQAAATRVYCHNGVFTRNDPFIAAVDRHGGGFKATRWHDPNAPVVFDATRPENQAASAGPKDVVICIDRSGSMADKSRMILAKSAAKRVLDTLTFVDFVTLVTFESNAWAATGTLVPATMSNKAKLKSVVENQMPAGGTNFVDAFEVAMQVFKRSRGDDSCYSGACNGALLFLTDGVPDKFDDGDFNRLKQLNADEYVKIFTFGLGSGAKMEVLERIADEHQGFSKFVPDGGDLANAMSLYYLTFSSWSGQDGIYDRVRWVLYQDIITKGDLLAGCMPAYDMKKEVPQLLGVTCMDINMVVDIDTLRKQPAFNEFKTAYMKNSRKCLNGVQSPEPMPTEELCGVKWEASWAPPQTVSGCQRVPLSVIMLPLLAMPSSVLPSPSCVSPLKGVFDSRFAGFVLGTSFIVCTCFEGDSTSAAELEDIPLPVRGLGNSDDFCKFSSSSLGGALFSGLEDKPRSCCQSCCVELIRVFGVLHLFGLLAYFALALPVYAAFTYRRLWL